MWSHGADERTCTFASKQTHRVRSAVLATLTALAPQEYCIGDDSRYADTASMELRSKMCGLCGALGIEGDWTGTATTPPSGARTIRAQRLERVHVVNVVLKQFSLVLSDWEGAKYQLSTRTGRTEIVENLAQVWQAAERLLGRTCDPLDPTLIERMGRGCST